MANKSVRFFVTVTFESEITDDNDIREIAENIADAIESSSQNGPGIAPHRGDTWLQHVHVHEQFSNQTAVRSLD